MPDVCLSVTGGRPLAVLQRKSIGLSNMSTDSVQYIENTSTYCFTLKHTPAMCRVLIELTILLTARHTRLTIKPMALTVKHTPQPEPCYCL